jgi:hypothetical protein
MMGRTRKDIRKQYQLPSEQSVGWDIKPEDPSNLFPIVVEAFKKLVEKNASQLAARLIDAFMKDDLQRQEDARSMRAYYGIGMAKGLELGRECPSWPEEGSLADAIWKHLHDNPKVKNPRLAILLEQQRREIPVPENFVKAILKKQPKIKVNSLELSPSFPNALKYAHGF